MADPFEVRMRFTSQLQHLNASVSSAQRAAQYALKNRDMDEDLHSCILEQLEKSNLNVRANIMFFLEHLCDMSQRDHHEEFIKMIRRDIFAIVDAVAPADRGGAANVRVVRKVLTGLQGKRFLEAETVDILESSLAQRVNGTGVEEDDMDVTMLDSPPSPPPPPPSAQVGVPTGSGGATGGAAGESFSSGMGTAAAGGMSTGAGAGEGNGTATAATTTTATAARQSTTTSNPNRGGEGISGPLKLGESGRPDKRQIEQRIEEDRERHKRLKESIWEVSGVDDDEFNSMWEDTSDLGDDDYARADEESEERNKCFQLELAEARDAGKV